MTLRIVHVVRQFAPSVGGLETVVARLASLQRERFGHDARVVTLDRVFRENGPRLPANEVVDGVPVTRLAWRGSPRYPLCPQVLGAIRDADLVHVHAIDFFFDWLAATRWLHGRPMVASTHGGFFHTAYASRLKRLWFDTITRTSSLAYRRILATSENDGEVFRRIAGDRVVVIENGADLERQRDAACRQIVPTLLFFGRWSTNKGIDRLLSLFAQLKAIDPEWRLIVAGRPYDLTRDDLARSAARLGVDAAVEFHESPSDAELRALMTQASYFACLSRHEGFGIAAIEAMSAGLVPLLSDIPPFRKIVEQSGCGLVLPTTADDASPRDAVLAMQRLHETLRDTGNPQRSRGMRFAERYEWSTVADRFDQQYREVLAPAGVAARSMPS